MKIQVEDAPRSDIDACVEALEIGFRAQPFSEIIAKTLNRNFYTWKYSPPAGNAVVASAKVGDQVVSMLSAVPLHGESDSAEFILWQIGDIVTLPQFRGRGLFRKCLQALINEIGRNEILICFPNRNSLPELFNQGFSQIAELPSYTRLVARLFKAPPQPAAPLAALTKLNLRHRPGCRVSKRSDFLTWRYLNHPLRPYLIDVEQGAELPEGVVVTRTFQAGPVKVGLIMELESNQPDTMLRLFGIAEQRSAAGGAWALMTVSNELAPAYLIRRGFLPLPEFLLPKKHVVVARTAGAAGGRLPPELSGPWYFQLGDWDGL